MELYSLEAQLPHSAKTDISALLRLAVIPSIVFLFEFLGYPREVKRVFVRIVPTYLSLIFGINISAEL